MRRRRIPLFVWPPVGTSSSTSSGPSDWKQTLRAELMKDVREQMNELSKTLLEEFRRERPNPLPLPRERSYSDGSQNPGRRPFRPAGPRFQWDEQGRPICNGCGEPGHYRRQCGSRRGSQGGFLELPPLWVKWSRPP